MSDLSQPSPESRWTWVGDIPLQRCGINVEFAQPFKADEILNVGRPQSRFRSILPRRNEQRVMTLQLGVGSPGAGASSAPNGWVFESSTEDGRQRKCLAVAGAAITFQTYEYSRWATVWEEVGGLLTMVMEHIGSENGLRAVHIDFINRFIWGGDISSATTGDLLTESNYVAANTLTCTSLWHSHHGYLQVEDGPSSHGDYLVNINLQSVNAAISEQNDDLSEGVVKRCIDVVLTHRFTSNDQKGMGVEATASSKANLIGQQLLRMRVRNKEILRAIIVSDVVKLIPGLAEA